MKKKLFVLAGVLSSFLFVLPVQSADSGPEFSADVRISGSMRKTTVGKAFVKDGMERLETVQDGELSVLIRRRDLLVEWTLFPDKFYMENRMSSAFTGRPETGPAADYDIEELGRETIDGFDCRVVQFNFKNTRLGTATQWIADELGIAIRIETRDAGGKLTGRTEYFNIKSGPQPDVLFELPDGYEKMGFKF